VLSDEREKFVKWSSRCDAIAGSASYIVNGYPELQVKALRLELQAAAADGIEWRNIYADIYECWHPRRPVFPDMDTMASLIEQDR
jgi:hypothetical protein